MYIFYISSITFVQKKKKILQFGNRKHHMRIALQTNQTSVTTTSLNGYHHCTILDIAMFKNDHNLTSKQQNV